MALDVKTTHYYYQRSFAFNDTVTFNDTINLNDPITFNETIRVNNTRVSCAAQEYDCQTSTKSQLFLPG